MLKTCTPVGQMGLTKKELCEELNGAFCDIGGEWENHTSLHLYPDTKFSAKQIQNIKDYIENWLEFVNRHNHWWICHIEFINSNKGFMMECSWKEINRVEVLSEMDEESESEL